MTRQNEAQDEIVHALPDAERWHHEIAGGERDTIVLQQYSQLLIPDNPHGSEDDGQTHLTNDQSKHGSQNDVCWIMQSKHDPRNRRQHRKCAQKDD